MSSKSREFAAYVPALILRRLVSNPLPPSDGEGRVIPAAALFADIAGSTRLANQLVRFGRLVGPEELSRILNHYYGPLISLIHGRGGDVVGFAGDAVLAIWPAEDRPLESAVQHAVQAALEIQQELNDILLAPGVRLSLRIVVSAGELSTALVGSHGFWQLVAYGPPLDQISRAVKRAQIGRVLVSKEAAQFLHADEIQPWTDDGVIVHQLNKPPQRVPLQRPDPGTIPESALRPFVPEAVRDGIAAGLGEFLAQSRPVSVVFARVYQEPGETPSWQRIQIAMTVLQEAAVRFGGTIVHLVEDDKGLIAVLGFGLPPRAHEDDPRRATESAVYLRRKAREWHVRCGLGISTGVPFCGPLGSKERRVYTVIGPDVIRAARLMEQARADEILCDEATERRVRDGAGPALGRLPLLRVKGFDEPQRTFRVAPPTPPSGRERELQRLFDALAGNDPPRLIVVEGEAPETKRLMTDLREQMAGRFKRIGAPPPTWASGRSPWPALWADVLGIRYEDDPIRRQDVADAFFAARPHLSIDSWLIRNLLDGSQVDPAVHGLLLLAAIQEIAQQRPVLLLLPGGEPRELLPRVLKDIAPASILVTTDGVRENIATTDWPGEPSILHLVLEPLDESALMQLAADRLGASQVGPQLAQRLRDLSQRNAHLLLEECERLLDKDQLITSQGIVELSDATFAPPDAQLRDLTPLVGRTAERAALVRTLDEAWSGQPRVILIEGDSGLGKSRLLDELRHLAADRAMLVLAGYCSAVEAATPYFPWRAIFDDLLGLDGRSEPTEREAVVRFALQQRANLLPFAALLNGVLGTQLPDEGGVAAQLNGQARADNLHELLIGLLETIVDGRPTLIVLEDAHVADSASWRLASLARSRLQRVAVALSVRDVGTRISTEYEQFAAAPWTTHLKLAPLGEQETSDLACARLGVRRLTPRLAALIRRRTQGNPLFVEQVVDHLAAAELIEISGGTAAMRTGAEEYDQATVPDTIRGLITARIDRLDLPCQLTAKVSSVIAPLFPARALAAIHPDPTASSILPDHVATLVREQMIREDHPEPEPIYDFPHPVIHQVCYELLPRAQRQHLHGRAAEWYQNEGDGDASLRYRRIAHHWQQAGKSDRQAEFLARAAETALRDGAFREAVTGFTELLRLSHERFGNTPPRDETARRAHWEFLLGEGYSGLGDLPAAVEHLQLGLAASGRPVRSIGTGLIIDTLAQFVQQLVRRLLPGQSRIPRQGRTEALEASAAYLRLAQIHYFENEIIPGINSTLRALNLAEWAGPSPELARAYACMVIVTGLLRWHRAARAYARMAETVARKTGHQPTLATVLCYLSIYDLGQGHWTRVERMAGEALQVAERLGDLRQAAEAATVLAMLACLRGQYSAAMEWFARTAGHARRSENAIHLAWALNGEGECLFRLGRDAEAIDKLHESAAALAGKRDRTEEIRIEGMLAALALRQGHREAAERRADAAEHLANLNTSTTCSTLEGFAGIAAVRLAIAAETPTDTAARQRAWAAIALLRRHARLYPVGLPRLALYEGRLYALAGQTDRAMQTWRKGLKIAETLDMPFEQAQLHACFQIAGMG